MTDPGVAFQRPRAQNRRPVSATDPAAQPSTSTPAPRRSARVRHASDSESPRHFQALTGRLGFALGARIPFGAAYRLGGALGRLVNALPGRNRAVTRINLALCFPELDADERERIARASLIESARLIFEAVARQHQGRTLIVIAHDYAEMARFDRVLVVDGGRVVQDGSHDQLLRSRGAYLALVQPRTGHA